MWRTRVFLNRSLDDGIPINRINIGKRNDSRFTDHQKIREGIPLTKLIKYVLRIIIVSIMTRAQSNIMKWILKWTLANMGFTSCMIFLYIRSAFSRNQRRIKNSVKQLSVVYYNCKKLHLRCLTRFHVLNAPL